MCATTGFPLHDWPDVGALPRRQRLATNGISLRPLPVAARQPPCRRMCGARVQP